MDAPMSCKLDDTLPDNARSPILHYTISCNDVFDNKKQKQKWNFKVNWKNRYGMDTVPEFRVTKSWSILKAVKGLTVIVAAYSIGESLLILCQTLSSFTM